jgi:hypothetical protein
LWSARVHGDGGRFERARVLVDERGRFVLETSSVSAGSEDRAVISQEDAQRLIDALVDEFDASS